MSYVWIGLGVVLAIVIFIFLRWIFSLREVVPTNEVNIVRQGKKTLVYGDSASIPEGNEVSGNAYYRWPEWVPSLGVTVSTLPLSVFPVEIKGYDAYDKERVPFVVDVMAFFRISNYKVAAERVASIEELKSQLLNICKGAVRSILAQENLEDIMGERSKYGKLFTEAISEQLVSWGSETVKSIELMDIRDADGEHVIDNIMKKTKSRIEKESRVTVAKNEQEAKEAEIAAQREIDLKQAAADQTVGMRKAEVEKEVGIATQQADQAVQDEKKTTKEKEMAVLQVETVRKAEIDRDKTVVDAEAERKRVEIEAEASKKKTELQAEADLTKATKNAEGIKAEGEAKATAEEKMQLASVTAQTTLAKEVGENERYQHYLIEIKKVEAGQTIGVAQAAALEKAGIKIVATGDGVQGGLNKAIDLFTGKGGAALEALKGTEAGEQMLATIGTFLKGIVGGKTQKPEAPKSEE